MSTQEVWILLLQHQNGFFDDLALENPVRAQHRLAQPKRDNDVVPGRIGRLGDIGRRWIRLGMSVGMNDSDEFGATILGVAICLQVHLRVDCVDPTRRGPVRTWVPSIDHTRLTISSRCTAEQSAGLIRQAVGEVSEEVVENRNGKLEHRARLSASGNRERIRSWRHSVSACLASQFPKDPIRFSTSGLAQPQDFRSLQHSSLLRFTRSLRSPFVNSKLHEFASLRSTTVSCVSDGAPVAMRPLALPKPT